MNAQLVAAAVVVALTALAPSVGGEWMILRALRRTGLVPTAGHLCCAASRPASRGPAGIC